MGLSGRGRLRRGLRFDDIDLPLSLANVHGEAVPDRPGVWSGPNGLGFALVIGRGWRFRLYNLAIHSARDVHARARFQVIVASHSPRRLSPSGHRRSSHRLSVASHRALRDHHGKRARALSRLRDPCANTSLAEFYRARDIEYPPLATVFGVVVLHVADALPEEAECLTRWRPEPTRGAAWARYEVALGLVLFAVDIACLALVHFIGKWLYPHNGALVHLVRLVLYVAATTALGLILYDRQDLVVALVAAMAVGAVARDGPFPRTSYSRPEPPISSFRFFSCRRACWPSRPSVRGRAQVANSLLPRCAKR